ncbi:MAG: hypothetical protein QOK48_1485, partial [Blastocatellia bacterium]|nr:hypothetical protein [Blastocatellia bacterium]
QQTVSVEKILSDLEFDKIPRLMVFNKSDLVDRVSMEGMLRHSSIQSGGAAVAISALDQSSLGVLLQRIGEALGPAMTHYPGPEPTSQTVQ